MASAPLPRVVLLCTEIMPIRHYNWQGIEVLKLFSERHTCELRIDLRRLEIKPVEPMNTSYILF